MLGAHEIETPAQNNELAHNTGYLCKKEARVHINI